MPSQAELERMRAVAEAALCFGGGPWAWAPHGDTGDYGVGVVFDEATHTLLRGCVTVDEYQVAEPVAVEVKAAIYADHIATFDPPTILALLAENERLRGALKPFADVCDAEVYESDEPRSKLAVRIQYLRDARQALESPHE